MTTDVLGGRPPIDVNKAMELAIVQEELFVWMTVHGNLCLALRHPENTGPSRQYVIEFVAKLGKLLVERGLLSQEQIDLAMQVERQHRQ